MEIALHLGAHLTDDNQLRKCLQTNADMLAEQGVIVPPARQYLELIRDAANHVSSGHGAPDALRHILEAVAAPEDARRVVFSGPSLLARLPDVVDDAQLYPKTSKRVAALREIFAGQQVEIFMAIRNPASFIPAFLAAEPIQKKAPGRFHIQPEELRWSRVVQDITETWPEAQVTLWCDEDTPFIWHQLLRLVAGHSPETEFEDSFAWFDTVMIEGGAAKLAQYLDNAPPEDEEHRQRVIAAFLDKFCDDAKLEIDMSITGWDDAKVDVLTELYDQDTDLIASFPNVRLVRPVEM